MGDVPDTLDITVVEAIDKLKAAVGILETYDRKGAAAAAWLAMRAAELLAERGE